MRIDVPARALRARRGAGLGIDATFRAGLGIDATFRVDGHHNALRPVLARRVADDLRVRDGRRVEADFVGAGVQQAAHIFHTAHAAAHRQRNEHLRGHRLDDVQDQVAPVAGRGNVEEGEFVGALLVVARGDFDRITGVAQFDEVDAFDNAPSGHVQAWNDSFREHVHGRRESNAL